MHFRSWKVIFSIEEKFCHEAKDNIQLFSLKKVVFRIFRFRTYFVHFLRSLQKRNIESSLYLKCNRIVSSKGCILSVMDDWMDRWMNELINQCVWNISRMILTEEKCCCQFVHHKSYMNWPGIKCESVLQEAATD
jgi:hypothetical protein